LELIELKTNIRTSVGNSQARALRRKNQIPAVLYGHGKKTVLLSVPFSELEQALKKSKSGQALLNVVVQNGETYTKPAIIKELQTHPVKRNILHVEHTPNPPLSRNCKRIRLNGISFMWIFLKLT
jgi:large subunit ribosomal protein L25